MTKENGYVGLALTPEFLERLQENPEKALDFLSKHALCPGILRGLELSLLDDQTLSVSAGFAVDKNGKIMSVLENQSVPLVDGDVCIQYRAQPNGSVTDDLDVTHAERYVDFFEFCQKDNDDAIILGSVASGTIKLDSRQYSGTTNEKLQTLEKQSKAYTDSVQENLTAHENTTKPHGATISPTADSLAMFDGNGFLYANSAPNKDTSTKVANTAWVRDFVFPVGCFCTQYPGEATPATKYGGTWTAQTQFYDRFARGSGNLAEGFRDAGLPNITGIVRFGNRGGYVIRIVETTTGAFNNLDSYPMYDYTSSVTTQNTSNRTDAFNINANRSSSIYGASSTVQPADYPLVIWKRTA